MALPRSTAVRVGAAAAAAVLVAEGAVWLLRPRESLPDPEPVAAREFFPPRELARAEDFRDGQRLLLVIGLAVEGGVLVAFALGRPRFVRRRLEALARRPVLGGAAAGAALSVTLAVAALPTGVIAHERAVDVGLSTQDLGDWFADAAKSAGIGAAIAAGAGALVIALVRRFPRRWWIGGAVAVVAFAIVFSWLAPVVLAPLFNRFDRLEPGSARSDVLELGRRAGVDIGEVYRVDASRRSRALNAYVTGVGSTKRVVIYDTLLDSVERPALRSVVAHELGHVDHDDIWRGIAFVAIVAPLGAFAVRGLGEAICRRTGADPASPAAIPAYALALAAISLVIGIAGNQLSRRVEASADEFALELTHDPRGLIQLQRELATTNISDPDPPGWYQFVFGTHPTTLERIGAAEAFEKEGAPVS